MDKEIQKQIEQILKQTPDPLGVRKETATVLNDFKFVSIDLRKIKELSELIKKKIENNQLLTETQFGSSDHNPQHIFILDVLNFCFWANKDSEKWTIEYPKDHFISNGWYGLVAAIDRALEESRPILDASYLANINLDEVEQIFRSSNSVDIPLLKERQNVLNEAGDVLQKKYNGEIYNLLVNTGLDAGAIALEIANNFSSFQDCPILDGNKVGFYKRAQIFAYDISFLPDLKIKNINVLTAFADYKIPQILRAYGILEYQSDLVQKIHNYITLESGSREEIEIRAATIWACELLAKEIGVEPVKVDNVLWKMSQSLRDVKPYHRVLSRYY